MNARTFPAITSDDLYCMGMESDVAYRLMPQLCAALGVAFPPELSDARQQQARRDALPDPLTQGETTP